MKLLVKIWILLNFLDINAQVVPERLTDWSNAGTLYKINNPRILNFDSLGGSVKNGFLNDTVMAKAISILKASNGGTIQLSTGTYAFRNTIILSDSISLKGEGNTTILEFNLGGASKNCIDIIGQLESKKYSPKNCYRAEYNVTLVDSIIPAKNAVIQIFQNDSALAYSNWSYGSIGQIFRTKERDTFKRTFTLVTPFRLSFNANTNTYIKTIKPIQNVSIECLKLIRKDSTGSQTNNINFKYAFNCLVKGVELMNCNFGHIVFENSIHNSVIQSYGHDAFAYGGNGQGYGIVCQATSSDNKIENNIFEHLRHSVLMQSGANGNVVAYNYSINPYWSDNAFKDAAGDLVCHGNYAHHNLFEGNICQNIVVDNSHGKNGPFNTFFRNRAELYGILISANQDSQNFIANEITNTNGLYGQFILSGNGHLSSNNNVKSKLQSNTSIVVTESSFYLTKKPAFLPQQTEWPILGYPQAYNKALNGAKIRFLDSIDKSYCFGINYLTNLISESYSIQQIKFCPNAFNRFVKYIGITGADLKVFNSNGLLIMSGAVAFNQEINTENWSSGIYIFLLNNQESWKMIKP